MRETRDILKQRIEELEDCLEECRNVGLELTKENLKLRRDNYRLMNLVIKYMEKCK